MTPAAVGTVNGPASIHQRIAVIRARFEPAVAPSQPAAAESPAATDEFAALLSALTEASTNPAAGTNGIGAVGTVASSGNGDIGQQIVDIAREYKGVPYLWGGTNPSRGLDCSGLVQLVLSRVGVESPRVSADQARFGTPVASIEEAQPGDLVAFGRPRVNHIGIYVGNGQMIHAPRTGEVVKVDPIGSREIVAIRRVTHMAPASATAGPPAAAGPSQLPAAIVPQVRRFEALFLEAGRRWGVDPSVLAAQAQKESGGRTDVVSRAGAIGLMQFMPATAASLGVDPLNPASAIDGAARYMSQMLQQFGSLELALAAYNAGPGAVRRHGNTVPPFAETTRYTREVLALARGPR